MHARNPMLKCRPTQVDQGNRNNATQRSPLCRHNHKLVSKSICKMQRRLSIVPIRHWLYVLPLIQTIVSLLKVDFEELSVVGMKWRIEVGVAKLMFIAGLEWGSILAPFQVVIGEPNAKIRHCFSKLEQLGERRIDWIDPRVCVSIPFEKLDATTLVILDAYVANVGVPTSFLMQ